MASSQQHVMILAARRESGTEEWLCPACGRRLLLRWPPTYEKVVLDPGDEQVLHVGSEGKRGIGRLGVPSEAAGADAPAAHEQLWDEADWRRWLDAIGIDWDGSAA